MLRQKRGCVGVRKSTCFLLAELSLSNQDRMGVSGASDGIYAKGVTFFLLGLSPRLVPSGKSNAYSGVVIRWKLLG